MGSHSLSLPNQTPRTYGQYEQLSNIVPIVQLTQPDNESYSAVQSLKTETDSARSMTGADSDGFCA